MANQVIGLDVEIKVANALAELRKLSPGADKEAKAITGSLSKALKDADREAAKAGKTLAKVGTASTGATGGIQKALAALGPLGGVLGKVSPAAGSAAASIAGLSSASTAMGAAGLAATAATGGLLLVIGGAALAVGGAAAAYYTLGESLVSAAFDADKALTALEGFKNIGSDFYPVVPEEALVAMERLASASDAVDAIMNSLTVTIGSNTAPAIERMVSTVVGLGLAGMEAFEVWAAGKNLLTEFAQFMTGTLLRAFLPVTDAVRGMGNNLIYMADLLGQSVDPALRAALKSTDALSDAITTYAGEALDGALTGLSDYAVAGGLFISQTARATDSLKNKTAATKDDTKAIEGNIEGLTNWTREIEASVKAIESGSEKLQESAYNDRLASMSAQDAEAERYRAKVQGLEDTAAEVKAAGGDELKTDLELYAATEAAAEIHNANVKKFDDKAAADKLAMQKAIAEKGVELALDGLDTVSKAAEEASQREGEQADKLQAQLVAGDSYYTDSQKAELQKRIAEHRKASIAAFNTAKAARIAEATITTAMAVVNALNDGLSVGGPAGLILGPVSAAAAGIAGGIQIAAIAAEQPSFHQGYAPDERSARVLTSEAVLSPAATAALGSGNIAAANAGIMGGGRQASTPVVFRHQTFRPFIKDFLTQPSALSTALNAGKIVGHRARN